MLQFPKYIDIQCMCTYVYEAPVVGLSAPANSYIRTYVRTYIDPAHNIVYVGGCRNLQCTFTRLLCPSCMPFAHLALCLFHNLPGLVSSVDGGCFLDELKIFGQSHVNPTSSYYF